MTVEQRQAAKAQLVAALQAGQPWQGAVQAAGLTISRSTAYSWRRRFEQEGPAAFQDGRHGHPRTLHAAAHHWLLDFCRAHPMAPSSAVQAALQAHWALLLSVNYLNRLRARYQLRPSSPRPLPAAHPPPNPAAARGRRQSLVARRRLRNRAPGRAACRLTRPRRADAPSAGP